MKKNKQMMMAWIAAGLVVLSGCASFTLDEATIAQLDKYAQKWIERLDKPPTPEKPPVVGYPQATGDLQTGLDAVEYGKLQWLYGGFKGGAAKLDVPRLSGLVCDGRNVRYTWDVGLAGWGLGQGDAGAICAVFIERADGSWQGGKFDWVSTSRASRELKHLQDYNGWHEVLPVRGRVAFVVVSADGRRRGNVIMTGGK